VMSMSVWEMISTPRSPHLVSTRLTCRTSYGPASSILIFMSPPSELLTFPDDLRAVLEDCLSEEASQPTLDKYLPQVRAIITSLLQGLRGKQTLFRQVVSTNRPKSDASGHSRSDSGQTSRFSRTHSRSKSSINSTDGSLRRDTQSSVVSSRRKGQGSYDAVPNGDEPFVGGFSFPPPPSYRSNGSGRSSADQRPPSAPTNGLSPSATPPPQNAQLPEPEVDPEGTPVASKTLQVPASVKRYSLVDKPMQPSSVQPPSVIIDDSSVQSPIELDRGDSQSPPPELPVVDTLTANPGVASSLAALKQSDALERRASKRFSTYNISKMTGAPRDRSGLGGGHPNRRSLVAGGGGALTAKELAALTEVDEESEAPTAIPPPSPRRQRSLSRTRGASITEVAEERPPVPPLPRAPSVASQPPPRTLGEPSNSTAAAEPTPSIPSSPDAITVFLQVGREVKKAKMEPGLTFSSLRMLFVDKFAYNPGQEDFPAIYIRDPSSGVQYELEDTDEVKERCLLSLNIERECISNPLSVAWL
jgi:Actin interacting protein 3